MVALGHIWMSRAVCSHLADWLSHTFAWDPHGAREWIMEAAERDAKTFKSEESNPEDNADRVKMHESAQRVDRFAKARKPTETVNI